jgi:hypothetical protein
MSQQHHRSNIVTPPEDPTWIEFKASDGDPRRWPTSTTLEVKGGSVNHMRLVPLDEVGPAIKWRLMVAAGVAKLMYLPGLSLPHH